MPPNIVSRAWGLLCCLVVLACNVTQAQHARYDTYTGFEVDETPVLPEVEQHPSLYFSEDFVGTLRERKADTESRYYTLWHRFRGDALKYRGKDMSTLDENDRPRAAKTLAFWWLIEEDQEALAGAIEALILAFEGVPQTGEKPYDEIYRATWLQNYAAAYDWVFRELDSTQNEEIRRRLADETVYLRQNIMEGDRLAPRPHNHRSKPAWAIGTAALVMSDDPRAADWLRHALEASNTVTRYQFSSDGIYREGGHYWMYNAVNLIPFLWHYLNVSGVSLFEAYQPAFEWPIRIRTGRGLMPNIEDSYLKPAPTHMVAAAYKGAVSMLNPDVDFASVLQWHYATTTLVSEDYTGATVDVTWEIDEYILFDNEIPQSEPTASPNQFLEGGQAAFRNGWEGGEFDRYLLFHGVADGDNHNHPDQLSFFMGGNDAILAPDAGYGPSGFSDDRRGSWYTTAKAHNIVTADGYPPFADNLLRIPYEYNITPDSRYHIDAPFYAFAEKTTGYLRPDDAKLRRAIAFIDQDYFVVADLLSGEEEHTYRILLHGRGRFARSGNHATWETFENRFGAAARLDAFFLPETAQVTDERGYVSLFKDERYVNFAQASQTDSSAAFLQLLLPASVGAPVPVVEDLSIDDMVGAALVRGDTTDTFLLQGDNEMRQVHGLATNATLTWTRVVDGEWQVLSLREGSQLRSVDLEFASNILSTLAVDVSESGVLRVAIPVGESKVDFAISYPGSASVSSVYVNGQSTPYENDEGRIVVGTFSAGAKRSTIPLASVRLFPNPFVQSVTVEVREQRPGAVTAVVYDILGKRIRVLRGASTAGSLRFTWDGRTEEGKEAAAGIYFVHISDSGGSIARSSMIRMR